MIAFCGIDCGTCEAFIATATDDDILRKKVANQWTEAYKVQILPEYINCTGCHSSGVKVHYCENMCEVRKCAVERNVETCAQCEDYPCSRLALIFSHAPHAEAMLNSLRK
ncbi:MAG: DUF3795 domain-containing protein [Deltaproteobacteria bacterium]|nr:DUF3795 domain-containing protein [Deltaproteobacteria bacterium]